jgi:hypothetical protein
MVGVADYQTLIAGVTSGTEVHVLDSSQDAVTQITNTLLGRTGISSLHIVSHGEAGGLNFGSGRLNLSDLPEYAAQLQNWGKALTDDADILLYGCNVAQGELGKAFTSILSQLTGADVAASDDLTGSSALGGDWDLEVNSGRIESIIPFSFEATQAYNEVLAINVAVVVTANYESPGFTQLVNQLNDDTYFDFNAVLVDPTQVDTITELNAYQAVVIGNDGGTRPAYDSFAASLRTWVEAGGGLVATGWTVFGGAANSDIDAIIPVFAGPRWGNIQPGSTPGSVIPNSTTHPITTGVSSFTTSAYTEYPPDSPQVDIEAVVLANGPAGLSQPVVVAAIKGLGKSAYLGPVYGGFSLGSTDLRSGDADRLLEQAVNWVAGPGNNPPTLDLNGADTGTGYTASFTVGNSGGAVPVVDSSNLTLTDDGTTIASATVTLTNPLNGIAESLAANAGLTGIVVNYNSGTGVLSLSGTSSIASYQQVLRSVTYNNTSLNPSTTPRTINFVVNDGISNSATATSTVNVTAVNNAPTVIAPSAIAVTEDITTTLSGISFADVDASNGIVTATLTVGAGTLGATSGGGVTVGGTATNRTLSGTLAAINSFITGNNLTYTTNLNATATQTLSVSLNDNGNTGTGGARTSASYRGVECNSSQRRTHCYGSGGDRGH